MTVDALEKEILQIPQVPIHTTPDDLSEASIEEAQAQRHDYFLQQTNILEKKAKELQIRNDILDEYLKALQSESKSRNSYSKVIFFTCAIYLLIALLLVVFNGSKFYALGYDWELSINDKVLMVLIGSTAINIIGMVTVVLKFIFTNHHHKILDKHEEQ